jgi:hypothetical protein
MIERMEPRSGRAIARSLGTSSPNRMCSPVIRRNAAGKEIEAARAVEASGLNVERSSD